MSLIIAFGVASAEIWKCLDDSIDAVYAKKISVHTYYLVRQADLLPPRNNHVALGSILTWA